ncbi:hypothetical protein P8825_14705 [Shouchella clausii]|uniref:hypothetical protein n=1 Tax=Shouchella clausii TaxID=79880 RepID=UPI002DB8C7D3|nr:hypothetical protein [Shouchella clausii]MEB5480813.1 hypothetical protein [Shouchella clausii]
MQIVLADNKKIKLEQFKKSNKRIHFLNKHILDNDDSNREKMNGYSYKEYYNSLPRSNDPEEKKEISARWIGAMDTQNSRRSNHIKQTLDIMASYILLSNEFTQEKKLKKFFSLHNENHLTLEQHAFKQSMTKNFIYLKDSSCFFYINTKYENFLKRRIKEYKTIIDIDNNHKNSTSEAKLIVFYKNKLPVPEVEKRLKRLQVNLSQLNTIKSQAKKTSQTINTIEQKIKNSTKEVKILVNNLADDKHNHELARQISKAVLHIRKLNDEKTLLQNQITDLYSQYTSVTELYLNFN